MSLSSTAVSGKMKTYNSTVQPIDWRDGHLQLLDQRKLPQQQQTIACRTCDDVIAAIKDMVVRGAPAIGIAAAYGVVLAARQAIEKQADNWRAEFDRLVSDLRLARPTAVNLAWAIERMLEHVSSSKDGLEETLLAHAKRLHDEDVRINQTMGDLGADMLGPGTSVITHCNAGALATAGYGTALGVIRSAYRDNKISHVFACETRPWLQGARLTAWELLQDEIPVTLLADHAAAQLMRRARNSTQPISWVITGADRVAANGDVANKIGTYSLALAARAHGVRMMVVAPKSTIDLNTAGGEQIPIEDRAPDELLSINDTPIAPAGAGALNPVFDVTPAEYIDALVTEDRVILRPDREQIAALF